MSKNTERKMGIRMEDSARAIIEVLEHHAVRHPGEFMKKRQLLSLAVTRAEYNIQVSDDTIHEDEAIPGPDEKWIAVRWSAICKYVARRFKKYIVWDTDHRNGVRLGSLEEYEKNQNALAKICAGIADCVEDRTRIIVSHGGQSFLISINVRLLNPGTVEEP